MVYWFLDVVYYFGMMVYWFDMMVYWLAMMVYWLSLVQWLTLVRSRRREVFNALVLHVCVVAIVISVVLHNL